MIENQKKEYLFQKALKELNPTDRLWYDWKNIDNDMTYDNVISIKDNVKKPSKKDFEAKLKEITENYELLIVDQKRQSAYQAESDSLFFKYQAGEATEQDWLDKRNEIKARFPK